MSGLFQHKEERLRYLEPAACPCRVYIEVVHAAGIVERRHELVLYRDAGLLFPGHNGDRHRSVGKYRLIRLESGSRPDSRTPRQCERTSRSPGA